MGRPINKKHIGDGAGKIQVTSSLLLLRQFNGSSFWPTFRTTERQRIHSNAIGIFRATLCGNHGDGDEQITDGELLHIHELRAPYAYVRFSRLRLSLRIVVNAPL